MPHKLHTVAILSILVFANFLSAQSRDERFRQNSNRSESRGLAEPFKGITTNGETEKGLFTIKQTGVSTEPVRQAALSFLEALTKEQRAKTTYEVEDPEWRKWMNQHFYVRQGVGFDEMDAVQRESAFGLLKASLSAKGLKLSRDIMNLNRTLGEMNNDDLEQYNEWLYWITIMGEPSATEPWGWQIDGHHLIINYFVLGDQVVMTPLFVGSEPVVAESGKFKGTAVLQEEQDQALAFMQGLKSEQQDAATIQSDKTHNNNLTEAFKDNVVLDYAGVKVSSFSKKQKAQLLKLIALYVDNMDEGHARVRMDEVEAHLNETYFAWVGGTSDDAVFYYRIHSPVVLIEFDHQGPVGLRQYFPDRSPNRQHIHVVVRTPNGNDYGKDILRQHHEKHSH
ncbi:MAG: DUF3500 domain-containing protein [Opitutales bacterium]|jgi:hypothetical protein|nr:DUF3500 domain-containing protein [Opitutales bacterium]MBT5814511.1 DUF3500 domain-containing protein [Opitutales bacterium]MBT6770540.1 DUF3500 domain-containing protein [Opitutales bacterium]